VKLFLQNSNACDHNPPTLQTDGKTTYHGNTALRYASRGKNKLWCESTTNPVPVLRIAASRGFWELTKNVIRSSHGHCTVHTFPENFMQIGPSSRFLVILLTKKERKKEIDRKQYPTPDLSGE